MNEVIQRAIPGGEDTLLLTVREAYMRLRISKWKLYDLLRSKQLEMVKIGRRTLIPLRSVEEFILKGWKDSLA
ncbi:helix-turn-helix domain-containing protein [Streptomyces sp. NBC_01373]|uniref:helix-turn-helix domain-containing protein n=1 Tax=Streptomyces sp. NBC_01373 TaxID=2903843 RepID=UPI00224E86E6|nr:helix-turn-helix domain-containing protein [Streptomyces sp. NBC_01373]MCX4699003.1 helix-turn-helix domain-containing protein [Streptomyces sp. NBC_01373]